MNPKLKVMTVVGTRPEIIRLSSTIKRLETTTNHVLVHTGQNYDYELNEVFFEDLGLRRPDFFLDSDVSSLGATLGSVLQGTERVIKDIQPDAMLVLGDTNSCISALIGKRLQVPVYHMEAGNRSFDENVPEETNRRLVDHVSDYNLVYTEHARRNLLGEGIHSSRILLTGSPMKEVLDEYQDEFSSSKVLKQLGLAANHYFVVSLHREENVDNPRRLNSALKALNKLFDEYEIPILVSTHPRTRKRLEEQPGELKDRLVFHPPFGFIDYIALQQNAKLVLSDSGTISEESTILGFPAVTLRDFIERPEAVDMGSILLTGVDPDRVLRGVKQTLETFSSDGKPSIPADYKITDTSRRVVNFIESTAPSHRVRLGLH